MRYWQNNECGGGLLETTIILSFLLTLILSGFFATHYFKTANDLYWAVEHSLNKVNVKPLRAVQDLDGLKYLVNDNDLKKSLTAATTALEEDLLRIFSVDTLPESGYRLEMSYGVIDIDSATGKFVSNEYQVIDVQENGTFTALLSTDAAKSQVELLQKTFKDTTRVAPSSFRAESPLLGIPEAYTDKTVVVLLRLQVGKELDSALGPMTELLGISDRYIERVKILRGEVIL